MLRGTRYALAAALLLGNTVAAQQTAAKFPESTHLDGVAIQEAIALGERGRPEPYWLYPRPGPHTATVAVYTPFVRVALAAHTASQHGKRVTSTNLPAWIVESDVHVVVRPQNSTLAASLFPDDPTLRRTPLTRLVLSRRGGAPFLDGIPPKWMTTDLSYLNEIGGAPFADAVAAAAFDAVQMLQNVDVYGLWQKENNFIPSHGFLDANEIRNWR